MDRSGLRLQATEYLGRYLATAPEDGRAWFELGRFYLLDAREWHLRGHTADPAGALLLDFAATALDQAMTAHSDSGSVFRALVEIDRAALVVEQDGWSAVVDSVSDLRLPELPAYIQELGQNLVNSCPLHGVLIAGSDLEWVGSWAAMLGVSRRVDLVPVDPERYAEDSLYRRGIARALGTDPSRQDVRELATVASRRPICLTPGADTASVPGLAWRAVRLMRVAGPETAVRPDGLSVTELLAVGFGRATPWAQETRTVYETAARHNSLLCTSLLTQLGERPRDACGR